MKWIRLGLPFTMLLLALAGCGGGGAELDARVLQLSVGYSVDGPASATMSGGQGAASGGAEVECRMAEGNEQIIGEATADEVGAFEMELDPSAFPQRVPDADAFSRFNETVECRPEGGSWIHPLRQPQISIE